MSSPSDEALLAGLASGDRVAIAAFVRRFQGRVFGLALTILRDPASAEDVAQETFVRTWRHAPAYDPRRGPVTAWILAIARNLAIDVLRVRRQDPVDPETMAALQGSLADFGPETDRPSDGEREQVRAAVTALPDEQRRALVLAAVLGRTAREISELDGIPIGTVKTRIRTAMLRLRAELEVEDGQSA